jgi:transcriptional regulator with XRE-family HTH domain
VTPRVANRLHLASFLQGLRDIDPRATRIMLGLSQRDVARMAGVSRQRVNDAETGVSPATELRLFYLAILKGWIDPLAEALGVPPTSPESSTRSVASLMNTGLSEGALGDGVSLRDKPARCKVCGRRLGGRKRKKPRAKRRKPSAGAHTPPGGAGAPGCAPV